MLQIWSENLFYLSVQYIRCCRTGQRIYFTSQSSILDVVDLVRGSILPLSLVYQMLQNWSEDLFYLSVQYIRCCRSGQRIYFTSQSSILDVVELVRGSILPLSLVYQMLQNWSEDLFYLSVQYIRCCRTGQRIYFTSQSSILDVVDLVRGSILPLSLVYQMLQNWSEDLFYLSVQYIRCCRSGQRIYFTSQSSILDVVDLVRGSILPLSLVYQMLQIWSEDLFYLPVQYIRCCRSGQRIYFTFQSSILDVVDLVRGSTLSSSLVYQMLQIWSEDLLYLSVQYIRCCSLVYQMLQNWSEDLLYLPVQYIRCCRSGQRIYFIFQSSILDVVDSVQYIRCQMLQRTGQRIYFIFQSSILDVVDLVRGSTLSSSLVYQMLQNWSEDLFYLSVQYIRCCRSGQRIYFTSQSSILDVVELVRESILPLSLVYQMLQNWSEDLFYLSVQYIRCCRTGQRIYFIFQSSILDVVELVRGSTLPFSLVYQMLQNWSEDLLYLSVQYIKCCRSGQRIYFIFQSSILDVVELVRGSILPLSLVYQMLQIWSEDLLYLSVWYIRCCRTGQRIYFTSQSSILDVVELVRGSILPLSLVYQMLQNWSEDLFYLSVQYIRCCRTGQRIYFTSQSGILDVVELVRGSILPLSLVYQMLQNWSEDLFYLSVQYIRCCRTGQRIYFTSQSSILDVVELVRGSILPLSLVYQMLQNWSEDLFYLSVQYIRCCRSGQRIYFTFQSSILDVVELVRGSILPLSLVYQMLQNWSEHLLYLSVQYIRCCRTGQRIYFTFQSSILNVVDLVRGSTLSFSLVYQMLQNWSEDLFYLSVQYIRCCRSGQRIYFTSQSGILDVVELVRGSILPLSLVYQMLQNWSEDLLYLSVWYIRCCRTGQRIYFTSQSSILDVVELVRGSILPLSLVYQMLQNWSEDLFYLSVQYIRCCRTGQRIYFTFQSSILDVVELVRGSILPLSLVYQMLQIWSEDLFYLSVQYIRCCRTGQRIYFTSQSSILDVVELVRGSILPLSLVYQMLQNWSEDLFYLSVQYIRCCRTGQRIYFTSQSSILDVVELVRESILPLSLVYQMLQNWSEDLFYLSVQYIRCCRTGQRIYFTSQSSILDVVELVRGSILPLSLVYQMLQNWSEDLFYLSVQYIRCCRTGQRIYFTSQSSILDVVELARGSILPLSLVYQMLQNWSENLFYLSVQYIRCCRTGQRIYFTSQSSILDVVELVRGSILPLSLVYQMLQNWSEDLFYFPMEFITCTERQKW